MKISALASEITDEGTWVDLPDWPGVRVCVRPSDHPEYENANAASFTRKGRRAAKDTRVRDEIIYRNAVKHLLIDWEGVTDDQDQPVPFDRDTLLGWTKDLRKYARFFGAVVIAANQLVLDAAGEREELGKS